jgi:hypothetical protein
LKTLRRYESAVGAAEADAGEQMYRDPLMSVMTALRFRFGQLAEIKRVSLRCGS